MRPTTKTTTISGIAMMLSLFASTQCADAAKLIDLQQTVSCQLLGVEDSAPSLGVVECEYECLCPTASLLYYVTSGGSCNGTIEISSGQCPVAGK
jgi:hypothetical protein